MSATDDHCPTTRGPYRCDYAAGHGGECETREEQRRRGRGIQSYGVASNASESAAGPFCRSDLSDANGEA